MDPEIARSFILDFLRKGRSREVARRAAKVKRERFAEWLQDEEFALEVDAAEAVAQRDREDCFFAGLPGWQAAERWLAVRNETSGSADSKPQPKIEIVYPKVDT